MTIEIGKKAPAFTLEASGGKKISLKDYLGKKVILYFYPRDNTPGCTTQACDFRDNIARLKKDGVVVLGVSKDSIVSHIKFSDKFELSFPLLSDPENKVATKYSAFGEKNMYGKIVKGTIRSTILIDEEGKILNIWSKVRAKGHIDKVLEYLASI